MSCRRIYSKSVGRRAKSVERKAKGEGRRAKGALRPTLYALHLALCALLFAVPAGAQFIDPQGGMIINVLREISFKHQLGLEQQRLQTAKLVQQLKQFYDTYTLMRQDVEFTQSLYRDFRAIDNMRMNNSFAVSNFILNADRLNYWLPSTAQDINRSAMDTQALLSNADELRRTYESFSVSTQDEGAPKDAATRRENAMIGQEAFSRELFAQALRNQQMAKTYDSMAVELYRQVRDSRNKFTEAERVQLLLRSADMKDKANAHFEKYLELAQNAHTNELNMFDQKMDMLRSKANWKAMQNHVNKISKIRYGFFDITAAAVQ